MFVVKQLNKQHLTQRTDTEDRHRGPEADTTFLQIVQTKKRNFLKIFAKQENPKILARRTHQHKSAKWKSYSVWTVVNIAATLQCTAVKPQMNFNIVIHGRVLQPRQSASMHHLKLKVRRQTRQDTETDLQTDTRNTETDLHRQTPLSACPRQRALQMASDGLSPAAEIISED